MRVLLVDNYDSFTWNLFQQVRTLGAKCIVKKNDEISLKEIQRMRPDRIILSPGPGRPEESRVCLDILRDSLRGAYLPAGRQARDAPRGKNMTLRVVPLLGVCLGHQCIAHIIGGHSSVVHAPTVMHGKTSNIFHERKGILRGVPSPFTAARYHSLVVRSVPEDYELMCWTGSIRKPEIIMGIRHKKLPIFGIQFHTESFMTKQGDHIMDNFLKGRW